MSLINKFVINGVVKHGDFILKSGAKSKIYFDVRAIVADHELTDSVCYKLQQTIYSHFDESIDTPNRDSTCVIGVPTGAVPMAAIVARDMSLPIAMVRDAPKDHGLGKQIEGSEALNVILVEDVITTGSSVDKYAKILEAAGRKVILIICILDREAGGVADLQTRYPVKSLVKMSDFVTPLIIQDFMDRCKERQSNLVVALDNPDPEETLRVAELVAPYVAAFKLHYDLYQFKEVCGMSTNADFINHLRILKEQYNFAIIEDRKFADIAAISLKQWQALPEEYRTIIDAVTVHPICGPDVVKVLGKEVGLLLVHQLSTAGNLIEESGTYSDLVVGMAAESPNVVGFVSQKRVTNWCANTLFPYLTFSPGVNLDATSDGQGQQWTAAKDTDFVIVGRGITEAADPTATAKRYRDAFWKP